MALQTGEGQRERLPGDPSGSDDDQEMLTLALLSYRGFHDARPWGASVPRLRRSVQQGLAEVAPVAGRWQLVWGPATYRSPLSLFDDTTMYVVRRTVSPPRFVVVIRGTNPVSVIDWLFGDLWAGATAAWPYGDRSATPDAAVSLSTALGLSVLRHLRASAPGTGVAGRLWEVVELEAAARARQAMRRASQPLGRRASRTLVHARREIRSELRATRWVWRRHRRGDQEETLERLADAWTALAPTRRRLYHRMAAAQDALERSSDPLDLLRVLEGGLMVGDRLRRGVDLQAFLRGAVRDADEPIEVVVAGHSKGGALAPVLALWLRDTQGFDGLAPHHQWDPDRAATISCWAFAGPTPGNRAFADRIDGVLGPRCRRIPNRFDLVPHAWTVQANEAAEELCLDAAAELYGPGIAVGLRELAALVMEEVGPLHYAHPNANVRVLGDAARRPTGPFPDRVVHEHLAAYIEGLGLHAEVGLLDFVSPLR